MKYSWCQWSSGIRIDCSTGFGDSEPNIMLWDKYSLTMKDQS